MSAAARSGAFPELDCMRPLLSRAVVAEAERRSERTGVSADRALIAAGALDEETYLRALAEAVGIPFEPLDGVPRTQCPLDDDRLIACATTGLLPLLTDGEEAGIVVAPRGIAARRIVELVAGDPAWARQLRLTSGDRMTRFILRGTGRTLAARAAEDLRRQAPDLSAAPPRHRGLAVPAAIGAAVLLAALLAAPGATVLAIEIFLASMFLAWVGLRLTAAAVAVARTKTTPLPALADGTLPVYSVVCALYREAASLDGLLRAIERLEYPPEKLDVILAVEADDRETRAAIAARTTKRPVTVVTVPAGLPRTKPKALNVALPFARGTFMVVYDAEDRPEPDQLRRALQAFRTGDDKLACVQARLCIDNPDDGWLARHFTAEYAGQFDVFLSGLTALRLPLPLGGSSNHFRTAVLREAGGWDAYNVTEDADLGMRLARLGYRSELIASTTLEEAPARFGPWLRQRTRWFKGWMQTWLVHMRAPRRLLRELRPGGFVAFQLVVGGNVLAALVHPLFVAGFVYAAVLGFPGWVGDDEAGALAVLYGSSIVVGYLTSAFLGWLGLARRGLLDISWVLLATPLHWILLSIAAWRALWQLIVAPYAWEKTEHGLARSSRRAARAAQALIKLERHLAALDEAGELPTLTDGARRRPRATADGRSRSAARETGLHGGALTSKWTWAKGPHPGRP
ncbi:MAG: glycosyltransferase family 2 protein [Pseudolabrys sp.]